MKRIICLLAVAILALGLGCDGDEVKDAVNDAAGQEFEYSYDSGDQQLSNVPGFCVPAPTVQQIVNFAPEQGQETWDGIEGHIDTMEVTRIEYRITQNDTTDSGRIELSVSEELQVPPDDFTLVAASQQIEAQTAYANLQLFNWIGDGRAILNGYLVEYQTAEGEFSIPYYLCGMFEPLTDDLEMTIGLIITVKIVLVPLS